MLITIDKRGSINLPTSIRKELGLESGAYMDLQVAEGGVVILQPVEIFKAIRVSRQGLDKLDEARQSGTGEMPVWLAEEIKNAAADPESEIP